MNRRNMIKAMGCTALALGMPDIVRAAAKPASSLYRNAIVIDGNMVGPWPDNPDLSLDTKISAQVRASGITAYKQTLGGAGGMSKAQTDDQIAETEAVIAKNSDLLLKITGPGDFAAAKQSGKVGVILSFEAGEMLEGNIDTIDHFRAAGVLVMGLSYNRQTPFASGTMVAQSTGLTDLGRQAVERMNALGVTLDVSHSDERSSLGALQASSKPVLITHAGCAAIHPHPRNKSDVLLRALADKGGVVGIYELCYLVGAGQPKLDDYLSHLTHALKICGEDHVGIGTDGMLTPFDTSPASMKEWDESIKARKDAGVAAPGEGPPPFVIGLNRPDRCAVIAAALHKKGYGDRTIEKVLGSNFQRVFNETWTAS